MQTVTGLRSNLLAFHLNTLEDVGLISRHPSHGDGRRRYVMLAPAAIPHVGPVAPLTLECVLFVCTHNAARSQLAAALWRQRSGHDAASAGTDPADRVHPTAVAVAADHGLDLEHHRLAVVGGSDAGIAAGMRAHQLDPALHPLVVVADAYPNFQHLRAAVLPVGRNPRLARPGAPQPRRPRSRRPATAAGPHRHRRQRRQPHTDHPRPRRRRHGDRV